MEPVIEEQGVGEAAATAQKAHRLANRAGSSEMTEVIVGDRVRIDCVAVRMSFPKDRTGQVSPEGVRLTRVFEHIVDATGFMPYVTEGARRRHRDCVELLRRRHEDVAHSEQGGVDDRCAR